MKRLFYILLCVLPLSFLMSSCLKDDDNSEKSPICMIAGFSVSDITSPYKTKNADGKDTTYNRTISGSSILFNIDQLNGKIESVDSLPNWVNITKVVPTVTYAGTAYYRVGDESNDFNNFHSGTDSIDFTKDVTFKLISNDGNYSRTYSVKIYKSLLEPDSLYWTEIKSNLSLKGNHRALSRGNDVYVFAEHKGKTTVTQFDASQKQITCSTPVALSIPLNYKSITLYQSLFYGLDSEGYVYSSTDGISWVQKSTTALDRLLASDSYKLYGYDGISIVSSTDGVVWTSEVSANIEMLPEMPVSSACYNAKTNSFLQNVVMMGANGIAEYTPVWFKISSSNLESDQKWNYINISDDNGYPMPSLKDVQMARFKDMLLAIGGQSTDGSVNAYSSVYVSEDNGITWHIPQTKVGVVNSWKGSTKTMTMVACSGYLWVIQDGGKIWQGEMSD